MREVDFTIHCTYRRLQSSREHNATHYGNIVSVVKAIIDHCEEYGCQLEKAEIESMHVY